MEIKLAEQLRAFSGKRPQNGQLSYGRPFHGMLSVRKLPDLARESSKPAAIRIFVKLRSAYGYTHVEGYNDPISFASKALAACFGPLASALSCHLPIAIAKALACPLSIWF